MVVKFQKGASYTGCVKSGHNISSYKNCICFEMGYLKKKVQEEHQSSVTSA